jgi:DNA repair protein SbcC/Rad50
MKLQRLQLRPFAGFLEKEIVFQPGLNVLLGANDVGKSTIFRALDATLFLPAKVSKSTKEGRELSRILPYGGDHARAALEFDGPRGAYKLEKSWGQGQGVSLEGPGGLRVSEDGRVEQGLRDLLPVPPVTYQSVLFMGQGALESTVAALEEKRDSLHSLSDFLRLAVDKNSGLSVDRLKALLQEKIQAAFSYWDSERGLPEKGRGIENPWQKNVGTVLAAYYAREEARAKARAASAIEAERDGKLAGITSAQAKRAEARSFVSANKAIVESASARQTLDAQIGSTRLQCDAMVQDLSAWMQAESDRRGHAPEVERLEAAKAKLEQELKSSLAFGKKREWLQRLEKARNAKAKLEEAKRALSLETAVKAEDLRRLRAGQLEVDALRTSLKAGKIQLQFQVKKELDVSVRKDLDPERKGQMSPGKSMSLSAGGRILLSTEYFELEVRSGEGRVSELEEQLGRKSDALGKALADFKAQTLEEAQEKHEKYVEAVSLVRSGESLLAAALAPGEKLEDLERKTGELSNLEASREPELIQAELQSTLKDLSGKKEGLVRAESLLKDLTRRHGVGDSAALTKQMIKKQSELDALEAKLAALPALPDGIGDLASFLDRYRTMSGIDSSLGEEIQKLSIELAELKGRMPEQSAQDLERVALEAAAAFDRELSRGRALRRVAGAIESVEGQGADIYGRFRREFERQVGQLSGGKYQKATMQESLPTIFQRADGAAIPYGWLSAGTKDAVALALRLSMASYFLGQAEGFLMIDDPMVNMDPEKQRVAAEMLREFGKEKQVLLFTCHPGHAELLGGNLIRL